MPTKRDKELSEMQDKLEKLGAKLSEFTSDTVETVEKQGKHAFSEAVDATKDAAGKMKKKAAMVDDFVQDNPWPAVIAAAVVGIALGAMMRGKDE